MALSALACNKLKSKRTKTIKDDAESQHRLKMHSGTDNNPLGTQESHKGTQFEGFWLSNNNTPYSSPAQPGSPDESQPASNVASRTATQDHDPSLADNPASQVQAEEPDRHLAPSPTPSPIISETPAPINRFMCQGKEISSCDPKSYETPVRKDDEQIIKGDSSQARQDYHGFREPFGSHWRPKKRGK